MRDLPIELFEDRFSIPVEEGETRWQIVERFDEASENAKKVNGNTVLARMVGAFFLVNGVSENGRYYSEELWDKAIKSNEGRIKSNMMLGTIGHSQPLNDQAILDGKCSHIITKLWKQKMADGRLVGMGELLILGTPAGRSIFPLVDAGSEFGVSSRGFGTYEGKTRDGHNIVNPDTFKLECFDFVRSPGVTTAIPRVVESKEIENENPQMTEEVDNVDEKLIKLAEENGSLNKEKSSLTRQVSEVLDVNRTLEERIRKQDEVLATQSKQIGDLQSSIEETAQKKLDSKIEVLEEELKTVRAEKTSVDEELASYKDQGTIEGISEVSKEYAEYKAFLAKIGAANGLEDVERTLEDVKAFTAEVLEFGTIEELRACISELEAYAELGTPEAIQVAFAEAAELAQKWENLKLRATARKLAKSSGKDLEVIETLISKLGLKEAKKMIKALSSDGESDGVSERFDVDDTDDAEQNEDNPSKRYQPDTSIEGRMKDKFSSLNGMSSKNS